MSSYAAGRGTRGATGASGLASRVVPFYFDPFVDAATGDGQAYWFVPRDMDQWILTDAECAAPTPGTATGWTVQVRNVTDTVDMLSTRITTDATEEHSKTATTQCDIAFNNRIVSWGDKIAIDLDGVPTNGRGLVVNLTFQDPDSPYAFDTVGIWTPHTPVLTAVTTPPTLGTGSVAKSRYTLLGETLIMSGEFVFGSSGTDAGSGTYKLALPVALDISRTDVIGHGQVHDNSIGTAHCISAYVFDANYACFRHSGATGLISHNTPWAWAASDRIDFQLIYEVA